MGMPMPDFSGGLTINDPWTRRGFGGRTITHESSEGNMMMLKFATPNHLFPLFQGGLSNDKF